MSFATQPAAERAAALAAPRPHEHMPALDGLRGIAVLLVVIGHFCASLSVEFAIKSKLLHWTPLGWMGVDLFFVLSGFLITGILYDSKTGPNYYKNFYARRALRIFPLYYLALTLVLLATPLLVKLKLQGFANPAWMWVYATNFVISIKGGGAFGVLDHFWSLAVEEHFYFVWPSVVFLLDRKKLMWVAAGACAVALALRLSTLHGGAELSYWAYMATPMRMDSLAAGAFLALLVRGPRGMAGLVKPAMAVAAAAFAAFMAIVLLRHSKDPRDAIIGTFGLSTLWAFFGAALLLALTWKPLNRLLSAPVLRWFGKISYGMYVWHPVVFMLFFHNDVARAIRGGNGPLQALETGAAALAAMFAVTLASWHLWEKQFLKLKSHFA